jgi:Uma2 family endonuclease
MQYNLLEILGMMSMEAASQPKLTVDKFFEAISGADERYELINGVAYAIDGAKEGHNVICSNVLVAIAPAGKKSGCRTTSSDTAVQTGPDTVRYPDVVVDCGPPDPSAKMASRPTVIVEVTSPGTSFVDYGDKLREYQKLESVDTVIQIESEFVLVKVHWRQSDGTWTDETIEDFGVAVPIPSTGASITLDDVYDTLDLRPRPRLVVVTNDHISKI